ncbi:MAG TPA: type II toxin-antitoxin system RelE/ParE family toxin [Tepidisphaeraceae bacterium]|nr:type II toxin-antitoxin system RelE/ParE family toxin [Tepidisphaeraceae bacterium]
MKAAFLASFLKDVKKLRDAKIQRAVTQAILNVEEAKSTEQIRSLKRLSGHHEYYRIRIGDWRIGVKIERDQVTFIRCLHRREIYRFFP